MRKRGTVLIFDDDLLGTVEAYDLLRRFTTFHVSSFSSMDELHQFPASDEPTCLILDASCWLKSHALLCLGSHTGMSKVPLILTTDRISLSLAVQTLRAGAIDVFSKPIPFCSLLESIQFAIDLDAQRRTFEHELDADLQRFSLLTKRERTVIVLVTDGLLNKQIADKLGVSVVTVKMHRGQIMRKMQVRSLPELVSLSHRLDVASDIENDMQISRRLLWSLLSADINEETLCRPPSAAICSLR